MAAMSKGGSVDRRHFLRASTGALVGGWAFTQGSLSPAAEAAAMTLDQAVGRVGRLPLRPLGSGGRKVSVLIGASDWPGEVIEAGVRCGVNYWHKAERFRLAGAAAGSRDRATPGSLLKDRDGHYCEVVVDRIRGNHETGAIDEEAHVEFVKQAVVQSGLRYFDDMVFHFGYHDRAEYRENKGFIRAFERLKKSGLVRRLGITQHHYNGNPKVPGGESAAQVLSAVMEDGIYEHGQLFYSYGESAEVESFVRAARARGFGTIAMKTTRGMGRMESDTEFMKTLPEGVSPYNALARWLTTETQLDAAVIRVRDLAEFADTCSGAGKPLRSADRTTLERAARYADRNACRLCGECAEQCPERLPIADILRAERYLLDHRDETQARRLYDELGRPADRCRACRACVSRCPLGLAIPEKLAQVHRLLA
ncbi:MAG: 4Fe-4S dicluster domain-containing protein [Vicinamibacteria bacterium]|nr:4Fe-4S dicluster domain-containing protein [Vicinamibacteria bacterium]